MRERLKLKHLIFIVAASFTVAVVAYAAPFIVPQGGTGATSFTSGGVLIGGGTSAITALPVMTNGQLLIGDGSGAPSINTLTAGAGVSIQNGAGSITISNTAIGAGGAWELFTASPFVLTPTSTTAGIFVRGASSTIEVLRVASSLNATSTVTDSLKVASDAAVTDLTGTGLLVSGGALTVSLSPFSTTNLAEGTNLYYTQARWDAALNATSTWAGFQGEFNNKLNATTTLDLNHFSVIQSTTTSFAITSLLNCDTIDTDGLGVLKCGSDAAGGGSGSPGSWEKIFTNDLTPTNTAAGIFVRASSTFDSTLRVNGAAEFNSTITGAQFSDPAKYFYLSSSNTDFNIMRFVGDTQAVELQMKPDNVPNPYFRVARTDTSRSFVDVLWEIANTGGVDQVVNDDGSSYNLWVKAGVNGVQESAPRLRLRTDQVGAGTSGGIVWGNGTGSGDANLYWNAADQLKSDDSLVVAQKATTSIALTVGSGGTGNYVNFTGGDLYVQNDAEIDGVLYMDNNDIYLRGASADLLSDTILDICPDAQTAICMRVDETSPTLTLSAAGATQIDFGDNIKVMGVSTSTLGGYFGTGGTVNTLDFNGGDVYVQDGLEADGLAALSDARAMVMNATTTVTDNLKVGTASTITNIAGTGLTITVGALQTTLGTSVDLASAEVTGILPVGNGGTGASTLPAGDILLGSGTSPVQSTSTLSVVKGGTGAASLAANGVLYGGGTSAVAATAAGTNGQLLLGVTGAAPSFASMGGDATISNAGVLTIADNAVDGTDLSLASEVTGDIMYFNGTDWVRLSIGSPGQVLEVNAGGTAPEWDTDDTGAGSVGSPGAWERIFAGDLTPTSSTAGIFVRASSTIQGALRVDGNATTTGNLTVDGTTLVVQADTNRVGVGTASPSNVLHVAGTNSSYLFDGLSAYESNTPVAAGAAILSVVGGTDATGRDAAIHLRNEQSNTEWTVFNDISNSDWLTFGQETNRVAIMKVTSGQSMIFHIEPPTANPQEATFAGVLDKGGGNRIWTDWTTQDYGGKDLLSSINIARAGTSPLIPFVIRFWDSNLGINSAVSDPVFFADPTGIVAIGNFASSSSLVAQNSYLKNDPVVQIGASSTAVTQLAVYTSGTVTNSNAFFSVNTNNRVGIGTQAPATTLETFGTASSSMLTVGGTGLTSTTTTIFGGMRVDSDSSTLVVNGNENRVGILTGSPQAPLDVGGTANFLNNMWMNQTTGGLWFDSYNNFNRGLHRFSNNDLGLRLATNQESLIVGTASTTVNTNLSVSGNASTTGYLVVGSMPTINMQAGDLLAKRATTTNLAVTSLSSCDVKTDANGSFYCGTDATGASAGAAWELAFAGAIRPTTTGAGIFVTGSSTFEGPLRIAASLNATSTVTDSLKVASDAAITDMTGTGLSVSGGALTVSLSPFSTSNLAEGTNLYYTDERVDDRTAALIQNGTGLTWTYNDGAGTLTGNVSGFAPAGFNGAWHEIAVNALTPTNTAAGIIVHASSTIDAPLNVRDRATTSALVIGSSIPPINPAPAGTLYVGAGATSTNLAVTSLSGGGNVIVIARNDGHFDSVSLPLSVANGGTGASSLTDGGILLGSGTGAITALGVAANGQIPIGDGTTDPVLATLTGTANEVEITNGAGSITIGIPDNPILTGRATTTGSLLVGTTNPTGNFGQAGDLWVGRATTTNLAVLGLNAGSCDVKADTTGYLYCGTDQTSGGGGQSGAWERIFTSDLTPTNTAAGIFVRGSSTVDNVFRITGDLAVASSTSLLDGTGIQTTVSNTPKWPEEEVVTIFASGHGFSKTSVDGTQTDDTGDYVKGTQSLDILTDNDGNSVTSDKTSISPTINLLDRYVKVWVKASVVARIVRLRFVFSSSNAFTTDMYTCEVDDDKNQLQDATWQILTIPLQTCTVTGSPNRGAINAVRLEVRDAVTGALTVNFNGISAVKEWPNGGVVTFTFDDAFDDHYAKARPQLDKYGYNATAYIIPDNIGVTNYLTLAQAKELQDLHGWDIASHDSGNWETGESAASLEDRILRVKSFMRKYGFNASDHLAYPQGDWSSAVKDAVRKYFKSARGTATFHETLPPGDQYNLRAKYIQSSSSLASLKAEVDAAVAGNTWLIFINHEIVDASATGDQMLTADFNALVDYVSQKNARVRSVSEVMEMVNAQYADFGDQVTFAKGNNKGFKFSSSSDDFVFQMGDQVASNNLELRYTNNNDSQAAEQTFVLYGANTDTLHLKLLDGNFFAGGSATSTSYHFIGSGGTVNNINFSGGDLYVQDSVEIDGTLYAPGALAGAWDFGGVTSVEMVNNSNCTLDALGEFCLDTAANTWQGSGGQFQIATSTDANGKAVIGRVLTELYQGTFSSSTPLISGQFKVMPVKTTGFRVVRIQCYVGDGTSMVMNLSDDGGTNDTNTVTCSNDPGKYNTTTSNFVWNAGEPIRAEYGTNTGNVQNVGFTAVGYYLTE